MPKNKDCKLEEEVKKEIRELLDVLEAWHYMPVQSGYGTGGIPDHVASIPLKIRPEHVGKTIGVFVGIEAKRLGKEATGIQERQLKKILLTGGGAFVIDGTEEEPGNFKKVKAKLAKFFSK